MSSTVPVSPLCKSPFHPGKNRNPFRIAFNGVLANSFLQARLSRHALDQRNRKIFLKISGRQLPLRCNETAEGQNLPLNPPAGGANNRFLRNFLDEANHMSFNPPPTEDLYQTITTTPENSNREIERFPHLRCPPKPACAGRAGQFWAGGMRQRDSSGLRKRSYSSSHQT